MGFSPDAASSADSEVLSMARRSRQSFLKRQRERQRSEKAALKRRKRLARKRGEEVTDGFEGEPQGTFLGNFGADPALAAPEDPALDAPGSPAIAEEEISVVETIPSKQD
jgi:hypothetical protein